MECLSLDASFMQSLDEDVVGYSVESHGEVQEDKSCGVSSVHDHVVSSVAAMRAVSMLWLGRNLD